MIYIIFTNFFCLNFCIQVKTYGYFVTYSSIITKKNKKRFAQNYEKRGMQKRIVIEEIRKLSIHFFPSIKLNINIYHRF